VHPATALATVLVDELVRGGVREVVLAPGSRSAPLAYAVGRAEQEGRLRLHVRTDERSAGFLALGLAKGTGSPVPVITTSGTAVANLHPAVLEAHHGGVSLLVLSADRPAELRGTGANQTTTQPGLFAGALRHQVDLPAPEARAGQVAAWRGTVCRALAAARGAAGTDPWAGRGPVHLNVAFRDPLAPDLGAAEPGAADLGAWPDLAGRPDGGPWTQVVPAPGAAGVPVRPGERTVVLLGDLPDPALAVRALDWAEQAGWPVIAEPFGVLPVGGTVVPHPSLVAASVTGGAAAALLPDRVLVVGRLTLFRELGALLRVPGVLVEHISATEQWTDPAHVVHRVHGLGALGVPPARGAGATDWVARWSRAGAEAARRVAPVLLEDVTGPGVAATVAAALGGADLLVLGSSNAPRDLSVGLGAVAGAVRTPVVANRGLAGIDGIVSSAVGAALGAGCRTVALMGDLTFLHDSGGLQLGPAEPRPDLTVVVVNDDGGGIFATLEYGDPARSATPAAAALTERVFGTSHGTDLGALCAAHGVGHRRVATLPDLAAALRETTQGLRVLEVGLDRASHRRLRARLQA
jgi:2-succinyl-5-enolpyruvyl-6-hydroxy-3-cyclohexene-1-carboxylate synthase